MAFVDVVSDINTVLYGIAAGIAILMITFYGIKWKISESSQDREEAKRGILNVIFGLAIIIIAGNLVGLILGPTPPGGTTTTTLPGGTTTRLTTTRITTTMPGWTTTSAETTTTAYVTTSTTLIECYQACIDNGYLYGTCKAFCNTDDEVQLDVVYVNCPLGTLCCCKKAITTSTTTTSITTSTTSTTKTTTTTTSTSTTTTVACAIGECSKKPDQVCRLAEAAGWCYSFDDPTGRVKGLDEQCGPGMRQCCCDNYAKCCGPPP
ncbi:MAG: pilin [Candidatus Altiarchaeota archaeon]